MTAVLEASRIASHSSVRDNSVLCEAGLVRVRKTRYGPMAYIVHDCYIGRSLDLYGEFSGGEAEFFSQLIKPGQLVLDVGANIGAHTVLFAQKVGPQGKVIAFEPQRMIHQLLSTNLMLNGLFNVLPLQAAAGSQEGTLIVPPVNYGVEGNFGCLGLGGYSEGEAVKVEIIDRMGLPACNFIKIDVEGMELEVLKGAVATLKKFRPVLYVENDRVEKSPDLIRFLLEAGYRLYWHLTPYFSRANFYGNPDNQFEGIVSTNMICVPIEAKLTINGAHPVRGVDDTWLMERDRINGKRPG